MTKTIYICDICKTEHQDGMEHDGYSVRIDYDNILNIDIYHDVYKECMECINECIECLKPAKSMPKE